MTMQHQINDTPNDYSQIHWIPPTEDDAEVQMFTGETSEFGMDVFSDPYAQAVHQTVEDNYKKMLALKRAYDKQEILCKMRADLRREYMTRKKQIKRLQTDAAVDFRNAEFLLQEHHHMNTGCKHKCGVRAVDISAPLVSQIQLPNGELLDLKTFNKDREFDKVIQMHENLRLEQEAMCNQNNELLPCWDENCTLCGGGGTTQRGAFGGCYDHYDEGEDQDQEQEQAQDQAQEPENRDNEWGLPLNAEEIRILQRGQCAETKIQTETSLWVCFSHHEAIEAASMLRSELKLRAMTDEDREAYCESLAYANSDDEEGQEESYTQHLINESLEQRKQHCCADDMLTTDASIKAKAKTKAKTIKPKPMKPTQANQPNGKKKKFDPIQIGINPNHNNQEMPSVSKHEIDLPKKERASRESKKRDDEKWTHINREQKHSNARGTH